MCAVYIELTTDALQNYYAKNLSVAGRSRAGRGIARRPVRGLEIKEDTYAMIKVMGANGVEIPLVDSGRLPDVPGISNFILQQVTEQRAEKQQILETFGDSYVFFFGESPKMLSCTAVLLNSNDFNWEAEWWENYDKYLRGTKLIEMGARAYLFYDDTAVEGYFMRASVNKDSMNPLQVQLQFEFFVTTYTNVSLVNSSGNFPLHASTSIPEGIDLRREGSRFALMGVIGDLARKREAEVMYERLPGYPPDLVELFRGGSAYKYHKAQVSATFAADVERYLGDPRDSLEAKGFAGSAKQAGSTVRSKISDNKDEYIGINASTSSYIDEWSDRKEMENIRPVISRQRSLAECISLFKTAISILTCFGANANSQSSMQKLGMGVSFGSPAGVGFGASASAKASYGPQPGGGWGASASASATSSAQAGGYAGASASAYAGASASSSGGAYARASASAYASAGVHQDPIGYVYGPPSAGPADPHYNEGAGDPSYGHASAYAGVGFGQAGFGNFGGGGYGSGMGETGDPGFKDPNDYTIAGEPDTRSAVEKFFASKGQKSGSEYQSASQGVYTGSKVEGAVSAFAVASFSGTLDPSGNARQDPQAVSDKLAQQKFGFAKDNPYGIPCLDPQGSAPGEWKKSWKFP